MITEKETVGKGEFQACTVQKAFPLRGRWRGEAVTDEVASTRVLSHRPLISRLRRQLPPKGKPFETLLTYEAPLGALH